VVEQALSTAWMAEVLKCVDYCKSQCIATCVRLTNPLQSDECACVFACPPNPLQPSPPAHSGIEAADPAESGCVMKCHIGEAGSTG